MYILPVVLVLIFAVVMSMLALLITGNDFDLPYQVPASVLLLIFGLIVILAGGYSFKKHQTTVNPAHPEKTSALVTTGLYRYSRNPMYVGFLAWLLACAILSGKFINFLFLPIYIVLVNRLYILPEERALERQFRQKYQDYKAKVRRWL